MIGIWATRSKGIAGPLCLGERWKSSAVISVLLHWISRNFYFSAHSIPPSKRGFPIAVVPARNSICFRNRRIPAGTALL